MVLKELVDNALDACEEAEVAPVISIAVEPGSIVVEDNARRHQDQHDQVHPGLHDPGVEPRGLRVADPRRAGERAQDDPGDGLRARSRAPGRQCRGGGRDNHRDPRHRTPNRIPGRPRQQRTEDCPHHLAIAGQDRIADHDQLAGDTYYGGATLLDYARGEFIRLAEGYVWFNPHLTLRGSWYGKEFINVAATNPDWKKWGPRNPTSPHWYDETRLQRYLAAHVARDRDLRRNRTVREFIAEFRGLSGTAVQRKVLEEVGCSHQSLAAFFGAEQVNRAGIAKLLASMRKHTKPVAAKHLGVIGEDHLKHRFLAAGGNADTFKYQQRKGATSEGIPYIVEFAFGLHQSGLTQGGSISRKFITGANWSVGISNPFRAFGSTGEGLESTLAKVRANATSPVICALHLASAYIQYADRGKSSIILTDNAEQPDD